MSPQRLAAWLMRAPEDAIGLQLLLSELGNEELVQEWGAKATSPIDLARDVCEAAQQETDERDDGACRFVVRWVRQSSGAPLQTVIKCRVSGKAGYQAQVDTHGVVAQSMRHNEAMARIYVGGMQQSLNTLRSQNDELRKENAELRTLLHDVLVRAKAIADGEDAEEASRQQSMNAAIAAVAEHIAPRLLEMVSGATAAPAAAATPDSSEH